MDCTKLHFGKLELCVSFIGGQEEKYDDFQASVFDVDLYFSDDLVFKSK